MSNLLVDINIYAATHSGVISALVCLCTSSFTIKNYGKTNKYPLMDELIKKL